MRFSVDTRVTVASDSELAGQSGVVVCVGSDSNPFADQVDDGYRLVAIDGLRGSPCRIAVKNLNPEKA
jgi:hypothetical protein